MGLALSGPSLPERTVNECLDGLVELLNGNVAGLDVVYTGRVSETKLGTAASVTSLSSIIGDTPNGMTMAYDYIIDVIVRIDDDYEAAERRLNAIHDGIWRAIWGGNASYWSDCFPYAADQKPASPQELVNWRRGILYVRVIPF
jgi:hypothetical protein